MPMDPAHPRLLRFQVLRVEPNVWLADSHSCPSDIVLTYANPIDGRTCQIFLSEHTYQCHRAAILESIRSGKVYTLDLRPPIHFSLSLAQALTPSLLLGALHQQERIPADADQPAMQSHA
jgi:hypothetical protein